MHYLILSLLAAAGLLLIVCAARNYEWFMNNRRAVTMTAIVGRTGTRVFYITFGIAIFVISVFFMIQGEFPTQYSEADPAVMESGISE